MERLTAFAKKWSKTVPGLAGCWLGDVIAARVISYGIHSSLAYDQRKYRAGEARQLLDMLSELGPHAQFWSDQLHEDFADTPATAGIPSVRLGRMTDAVFEVGVIAANETTGFIWWRGEDD